MTIFEEEFFPLVTFERPMFGKKTGWICLIGGIEFSGDTKEELRERAIQMLKKEIERLEKDEKVNEKPYLEQTLLETIAIRFEKCFDISELHQYIRVLLSHLSTLEEKLSYWKHEFDLELAHSKQAEAKLESSESIRMAEKEILIKEIEKNTTLETRVKELEEGIEKIIPYIFEHNMLVEQETDFEKGIVKLYNLLKKNP